MRLFGQTYSGLEYDYRGLLHVYEQTNDNDNFIKFCDILDEWRVMRLDEKRVNNTDCLFIGICILINESVNFLRNQHTLN